MAVQVYTPHDQLFHLARIAAAYNVPVRQMARVTERALIERMGGQAALVEFWNFYKFNVENPQALIACAYVQGDHRHVEVTSGFHFDRPTWTLTTILAHEMGHVLGRWQRIDEQQWRANDGVVSDSRVELGAWEWAKENMLMWTKESVHLMHVAMEGYKKESPLTNELEDMYRALLGSETYA